MCVYIYMYCGFYGDFKEGGYNEDILIRLCVYMFYIFEVLKVVLGGVVVGEVDGWVGVGVVVVCFG